jgi:hypothetical protein
MKGADGMVQGYNAQAAVEPTLLLIVGQSVTEAANDKQQLKPMVELIEQQSGQRPEAVLADNGYCSEENLDHLESAEQPERRIEGFIATGKQKHGEHRLPAKRGPLPQGATKVDRMKRKLQTKVGKAVYAMRKCVVEPVFGQIKQSRGFRQFLLRGKEEGKTGNARAHGFGVQRSTNPRLIFSASSTLRMVAASQRNGLPVLCACARFWPPAV